MKRTAIIFCILVCFSPLSSICAHQQKSPDTPNTIRGTVHDQNKKPIPYVNVFLEGTFDGEMTDEAGRFTFHTKERGEHKLIASAVGYKRSATVVLVSPLQPVEKTIILQLAVIETDEVVVTASSYGSESGKGIVLSAMDVITTPGGAADIYQSIKTLPGMTLVSESAELFVRGGDPTETTTIVDQATVYHPYTFESAYGGIFSNVNTGNIKGMFFSSGGFSAKYGNALSGILDLQTKDVPAQLNTSLGISMANASLASEIPLWVDRVGIRVDARQSFTRPMFLLNGGIDRFTVTPASRDISLSFNGRYSTSGRVKLFSLVAEDRQGIHVDRPEFAGPFSGKSTNQLHNLQVTELLGDSFYIKGGLSFNRFRSHWALGVLDLSRTDDVVKLRTDAEYQLNSRSKFLFGFEREHRRLQYDGRMPAESHNLRTDAAFEQISSALGGFRYGVYGEYEAHGLFGFTDLVGIAGLRADYVRPLSLSWIDPRVSLGYKLTPSAVLRFSWGIFHQLPDPRLLIASSGNVNLQPMKAIHYIVSFDHKVDATTDLRVELYHKSYDNLPLEHSLLKYDNGGYGYARGIDVLAKGWLGPLSGWISYGFVDTKRKWLDYKDLRLSTYDVTHNLALIAKYNVTTSWQIGLNYKLATGRPFTPVEGARYDSIWSVYEPLFGEPNSMRYPLYQRLDLRLTHLSRLFDRFTVFYLEGLNILNITNIFAYTYNSDYSVRKEIESYFGRRMIVAGVQMTI